jgi:hypothetical protein
VDPLRGPAGFEYVDGALQLSVMLDPGKQGQTCSSSDGTFKYYLNGQVNTPGFQQTYGTFAARSAVDVLEPAGAAKRIHPSYTGSQGGFGRSPKHPSTEV